MKRLGWGDGGDGERQPVALGPDRRLRCHCQARRLPTRKPHSAQARSPHQQDDDARTRRLFRLSTPPHTYPYSTRKVLDNQSQPCYCTYTAIRTHPATTDSPRGRRAGAGGAVEAEAPLVGSRPGGPLNALGRAETCLVSLPTAPMTCEGCRRCHHFRPRPALVRPIRGADNCPVASDAWGGKTER